MEAAAEAAAAAEAEAVTVSSMKKIYYVIVCLMAVLTISFCSVSCVCIESFLEDIFADTEQTEDYDEETSASDIENTTAFDVENSEFDINNVPEYTGSTYIEVCGNIPSFYETDYTAEAFEDYSELDSLGRCGRAYACLGRETMPEGEREPVGSIKPTGWHTVKYEFIEGKYLYNRCHLIAYQLSAENANIKNLITGTRYLNIGGMLSFEKKVIRYIENTGNHVLYRVTPIFVGDNLVASGVQMEAFSVEDKGEGICFNVFVYNVQPGVEIDYLTGESRLSKEYESSLENSLNSTYGDSTSQPGITQGAVEESTEDIFAGADFIINTSSLKFHKPDCESVKEMSNRNKKAFNGSREELIELGYIPCKVCNP